MNQGTNSIILRDNSLMIPIITDSQFPDHLEGLGIPFLKINKGYSTYLEYKENGLSLITETMKNERQKPIQINFLRAFSRFNPSDKKGPFFKALGPSLKKGPVWDLTCGMGSDSLLMLFFGAEVIAFERNNIIGALLMDAYHRALMDTELGPIFRDRFSLLIQDAREAGLESPSIIYFDPMYENKERKALQKKEMRVFREIVGSDDDAGLVLKWALKKALDRVVVKRSLRAPELLEGVTFSHKGKSTRYDVYKTNLS